VAEGARLESVYTGNRIVGSNPTPSANLTFAFVRWRPLKSFESSTYCAMLAHHRSRRFAADPQLVVGQDMGTS
jgi:hypothetical protein